MNVKDFDIPIPEGDMMVTIFSHQRQLMNRYHEIEEKNLGHAIPYSADYYGPYCGALDVDDRASQLRFKDFAWRVTEELTEATLALNEDDVTHYEEELIDALHFAVELVILCGLEKELGFKDSGDSLSWYFSNAEQPPVNRVFSVYNVVEQLGEAMNRLKLKPWKTTAMLTDREAFKKSMVKFFQSVISLLKASGFDARTATAMYLNKNAVNQFRQASNY